jgi:hypothetical protein
LGGSLYVRELYMANIAPPITRSPKRPNSDDVWCRPITRGQLRDIGVTLDRFGLATRDQALGYCSAIVDRAITSRRSSRREKASRVLGVLEDSMKAMCHCVNPAFTPITRPHRLKVPGGQRHHA